METNNIDYFMNAEENKNMSARRALLPIVSAARRTFAADAMMRTWPRNVSDPETAASATLTRSSKIWIKHAKISPLQASHDEHSGRFRTVCEAILSSS